MEDRAYLIGLDIGGGSGRCVAWNPSENQILVSLRRWSHLPSRKAPGLGYDMDLDGVRTSILNALRELVDKGNLGKETVSAIGVTGMRNTTVILDDEMNVVFAVPNQDARAVGESAELASGFGMLFHRISGHYPAPIFTAPRLKWIAANEPEIFERTRLVMTLTDWVCYLLTGEIAADATQSGETMLFDLEKRCWSDELMEIVCARKQWFADVVPSGHVVGYLLDEIAEFVGLKKKIPVVTSGADTQCALLGAGAVTQGDVCAVAGTTMPLQQVTTKFVLDEEGKLWSGLHVLPGMFVLESNGLAAGTALEWFSKILFPDYDKPVAALLYEAGKSSPGAGGVLSTLGTCLFDARSLNISFGDITLSHMVTPSGIEGREHVCRAVAEGIAFSLKCNLEQILACSKESPETLKVAGRMATSPLWTQIVCDVVNMKVEAPKTPEVSGLGACALAGVGAGVFENFGEVCQILSRIRNTLEPSPSSNKYSDLYASWNNVSCSGGGRELSVIGHMASQLLASQAQIMKLDGTKDFRPRVLITAPFGREALGMMEEFADVEYAPWWETHRVYQGGKELARALRGYQVFITEMDVIDFEAIQNLPELRVIISCRGNPVNVDIESATEYGIAVINTPGRNADAVADLVLAFMIILSRKLIGALSFLKTGNVAEGDLIRLAEAYERFRGNELWGKKVGIIGFGNVGKAVAKRARSFGASILFYDPYVDEYTAAAENAEKCSFDEVLSQSDFVTVHVPANEKTKRMIDYRALSMMKRSAYLINTARASIVDEEALLSALQTGQIAGAALDVFSTEPPGSDNPLVRLENVITTPHVGGDTFEVSEHQGMIAFDQLNKLLLGRRPEYLLNTEVLPYFTFRGKRREPSEEIVQRLSKKNKPKMTS